MAEIQPLRALHYDQAVVGALADVVAPPYDVIDDAQRAALLERSPNNVVAVDLPKGEGDVYTRGRGALRGLAARGRPGAGPGAGPVGPHPATTPGPDGVARTRRGFFCRVRIEPYGPGRVRPHERTHPGPKEDRLRLTRATRANISPIFSLYSDPRQAAWEALAGATAETPWAEVTDGDGTVHRIWRVSDPAAIAAVQAATAPAELLIADGHHRYETMQAYAEERDREGAPGEEHRYILMCLVALEDPGLTIFPTHRLVSGLDEARRRSLQEELERDFVIEEVPLEQIAPDPGDGALQLGYFDGEDGVPQAPDAQGPADRRAALAVTREPLPRARHRRARDARAEGGARPERR